MKNDDIVVVVVDFVVIDENAHVVVLVAVDVVVEVGLASVLFFSCYCSFSFSFFYRPSYPS